MPRKAGEVLFTPHGRDANTTSAGPGRGSAAFELALEALSPGTRMSASAPKMASELLQ